MHTQTAAQMLEHSTAGRVGSVSAACVPRNGEGAYMFQRAASQK